MRSSPWWSNGYRNWWGKEWRYNRFPSPIYLQSYGAQAGLPKLLAVSWGNLSKFQLHRVHPSVYMKPVKRKGIKYENVAIFCPNFVSFLSSFRAQGVVGQGPSRTVGQRQHSRSYSIDLSKHGMEQSRA